jgi:hypothetical protein
MPDPDPNTPPDPFEGVTFPDKFKKDGKPDLKTFVNSYGELETRFNTKTEELKAQVQADLLKDRPKDKAEYKLPKIDGVKDEELSAHPMIDWWREEAFAAGIPQAKFETGIKQYIEKMAPKPIPDDQLKAALGDGFKTRISAVDTWAQKTAKSPGELAALQRVGTDPEGIKLMERLMGLNGGGGDGGGGGDPPPETTLETLREMQKDPKYWDNARRDPAFVKKVEDGYKKLYPEK